MKYWIEILFCSCKHELTFNTIIYFIILIFYALCITICGLYFQQMYNVMPDTNCWHVILLQVWKQKKVWEGFVRCCQRTKPQSFQVNCGESWHSGASSNISVFVGVTSAASCAVAGCLQDLPRATPASVGTCALLHWQPGKSCSNMWLEKEQLIQWRSWDKYLWIVVSASSHSSVYHGYHDGNKQGLCTFGE